MYLFTCCTKLKRVWERREWKRVFDDRLATGSRSAERKGHAVAVGSQFAARLRYSDVSRLVARNHVGASGRAG